MKKLSDTAKLQRSCFPLQKSMILNGLNKTDSGLMSAIRKNQQYRRSSSLNSYSNYQQRLDKSLGSKETREAGMTLLNIMEETAGLINQFMSKSMSC